MYISAFFIKSICRQPVLLLSVAALLNVIATSTQSAYGQQLRMTQREIINLKATGETAPGSSNSSAVQVVVIYGDPSKAGLYTILLKVAANTRIAAHLHPDERIGTVVSGTWYFGYGNSFEVNKLKKLSVGSVYSEAKDVNHFAMTRSEAVIVQITGYGPSGVTYKNPADDPTFHKRN